MFRSPSCREVLPLIRSALREDRAALDITSRLLYPPDAWLRGRLVARERGILCGIEIARWVFQAVDRRIRFRALGRDGSAMRCGAVLARVEGPARAVLAAERTAVNLLSRLSGVATLTDRYVRAVRGTPAAILDTRKTTPGLRLLERYAVRCGGGVNHRFDLRSQVLIKSNHLRGLRGAGRGRSVARLLEGARRRAPRGCRIEIEVSEARMVPAVLAGRPDIMMLDNLSVGAVRRIAWMIKRTPHRPLLEVSGGVTLRNVRSFALAGAERIAIGALTHSARWLDVAFEVVAGQRRSGQRRARSVR